MSVLRLELEIDSEVHPELHAQLVALGSGASRGERVRQLASTGLIWEMVRTHGTPSQLPGPSPKQEVAGAPPARQASTSARDDFIDLALDAVPAASAAEPAFDSPSPHIPVLRDVVGDWPGASGAANPRGTERAAAEAPAAAVVLMHRAAPRSRLMRMKDKGLFRNG